VRLNRECLGCGQEPLYFEVSFYEMVGYCRNPNCRYAKPRYEEIDMEIPPGGLKILPKEGCK